MNYTVIFNDGTEEKFYILGVAELNARLYGGRVVGTPTLRLVTVDPRSQPMLPEWVAA
jgi:hypothetical protein